MALVSLTEMRNAARGLLRTPTISLSAILCLGLGIGATTAIWSAISRALLQSLPFREPAQLVAVHRITPHSGPQGTWPSSAPNYVDLAQRTRQLQALAAVSTGTALVNLPNDAVQASQLYVTGNLFPLLGVHAARGRLILPADDQLGQPEVAVVSDEFWRTALAADPAAVGKTISIDGEPTTVVGIAPPDFRIPHAAQFLRADIWSPIRFTPQQLGRRRSNYLLLLGRLAPSATPTAAEAELKSIFRGMVAEHPELKGEDVRVAALVPESVQSVRTPLLLLFGAVCLVLLIAATNVAALLLARGVQRRREMAVRTALGATRWDAMRPALLESVLIAVVGAAVGLALAGAGVRTIGVLAAARLPQLAGLSLDGRVIGFGLALAAVVAVACGAIPAWRSAAVDPQDALRGGRGAGAGREHHRALGGLVVLEIALSVVLLIGAGLVLRGFAQLLRNDPGFETAHLLTLRVAASPGRDTNESPVRRLLEPALDEIATLPGVESAAAISVMPYVNWGNNSNIRYEGRANDDPTQLPLAEIRVVTPSFFAVTKQRLLAGRLLRPSDDESPTSPAVVVVNQALAERDFKGLDPVGKRFHTGDTTFATIVGVVSNIRNAGPVQDPAPEMYWTYRQSGLGNTNFPLLLRVRGDDPTAVAGAVRAAIRRLDPSAAIANISPMPEVIAKSLGRPRFYFSLLGTFAAVAIILAVAGLYGVLSYAVARRTRDLGIRAALGSPKAALLRLVAWDGMRLVIAGLVLGLAGGAAVTRLMVSMIYGVSPLDPATWVAAAAAMLASGVLATLIPARRATRVHPIIAMQAD